MDFSALSNVSSLSPEFVSTSIASAIGLCALVKGISNVVSRKRRRDGNPPVAVVATAPVVAPPAPMIVPPAAAVAVVIHASIMTGLQAVDMIIMALGRAAQIVNVKTSFSLS